MRLKLDDDACMGHGRCYSLAPDLFDADDEGHGVLLTEDVAADLERGAYEAQESCPESAISVTE